MDRPIVYVNENPLDTDFLGLAKSTMIALGMAMKAVLGTSTLLDGLACTPTGPASMQVVIAPGSIYSLAAVDATAYGSLGADTADQIVKQGILLSSTTLSALTAPATSGQSVNVLIQAEYQDVDAGSTTLPYYDSSNPPVAYNGPNNTGVSQNTVRRGALVLSAKVGAAASTGSQATPAPDAGYVGLWVITIANGQTTIVSGNIATYTGAPFITEKMTAKISQATGDARYQLIGNTRSKLTANTVFYVSTTGSDSNNGLTSGTAWLTLQNAWNILTNTYDLGPYTATIQMGDGTYAAGVIGNSPTTGSIIIQGNASTPTSVNFALAGSTVFSISNSGTPVTIKNLMLSNSAGNGVVAQQNAQVTVNNLTFGNMSAGNMCYATANGIINIISAAVTGSALNFCSTDGGSKIFAAGASIAVSGTPNFSGQFIVAVNLSTQLWMAASISGTAAGTRYQVNENSVINTAGGGANFFPGNVAGGASSGGVYV